MSNRFTPAEDAELLGYIEALDDAVSLISWMEDEGSAESDDVYLRSVLMRAAEFLVDLRERRNGGGAT